jgi:hypothetical protein
MKIRWFFFGILAVFTSLIILATYVVPILVPLLEFLDWRMSPRLPRRESLQVLAGLLLLNNISFLSIAVIYTNIVGRTIHDFSHPAILAWALLSSVAYIGLRHQLAQGELKTADLKS